MAVGGLQHPPPEDEENGLGPLLRPHLWADQSRRNTQDAADAAVPVPNPRTRIGASEIGCDTASGSIVIAPAPRKGTQILICAKDYASTTITSGPPDVVVTLQKQLGSDCPPFPTPSPTPDPPKQ